MLFENWWPGLKIGDGFFPFMSKVTPYHLGLR